jgi:hypothetical protein
VNANLSYPRTSEQRSDDFTRARQSEELVGEWLGQHKIGSLDSTTRLDWWVPGFFVEVKQKNQPLSSLWPLPCAEPDAFILDELSVRKAMEHFPNAYFMLNDVPCGRWFLARIDEVCCADRLRINREGSGGRLKGKWVLDLSQFRHLVDPASELLPAIFADQVAMPWKGSALLVNAAIS